MTFVGENRGKGMVTLPVSGTSVKITVGKPGSSILGWLSHAKPFEVASRPTPAVCGLLGRQPRRLDLGMKPSTSPTED